MKWALLVVIGCGALIACRSAPAPTFELDGEYYVDGPCFCDWGRGVGVEALWQSSIDPMLRAWLGPRKR